MDCSTANPRVRENPFGRLPDTVLLHIMRDCCNWYAQQQAYGSCKDIRDVCDRNMKSVTVQPCSDETLLTVHQSSSKTMCPKAAPGLKKLVVRFSCWKMILHEAYTYLSRLVDDAFAIGTPSCRVKQLANISEIELHLPNVVSITEQQCQTIWHLLSRFPNLQRLQTNAGDILPFLCARHLQQLVCRSCITPHQLQLFAEQHSSLQELEFVFNTQFEEFQQPLLLLKGLKHLKISSGAWLSLPAGTLTVLTRLSALALDRITVTEAHLLQKLHITHSTLGRVKVDLPDQLQLLPAEWPVLQSVDFMLINSNSVPVTESLARVILPVPRPGFSVTWPGNMICYQADVAPDLHFG